MKILFSTILIGLLLLIAGCDSDSKTTNTKSSTFKAKKEKITFLEKYVTFKRNYEELDFYISYQDNSGGMLSAPSDWDIGLIAIVPQNEINLWFKGLNKIDSLADQNKIWLQKLPGALDSSKITEWYEIGAHSFVGVDSINRIVVYKNSTR